MRFMSPLKASFLAILVVSVLSLGCVGEDLVGTSKLELTIGGGEALRVGFPHKEGNTTQAFVDGWTAKFTKYVVILGNITLTHPETKAEVSKWNKTIALDLMAKASQNTDQSIGSETLTTITDLPARRLDVAFELSKATSSVENKSVSAEDWKEMVNKGWSTLIEGEATKNGETIKFRFGLDLNIRYYDCVNGKDKTQGIALENQKTTVAFIYTHAIHLFWDSLSSGDEDVRFDAFAAVAGDDNMVTSEELTKQDLTQLKNTEGKLLQHNGKQVFYNDGGLLPPDNLTLLEFFKYGVRSSIHFNGLGLCKAKILQ